MKKFDLVIVGEGISGLYAAYLSTLQFPEWKIAIIADSSQLPPCSYRSTAVVSQSGIQFGVSSLGDLLIHANHSFFEHVYDCKPQGVYPGVRYHLSSDGRDDFKKRWPQGSFKKLDLLKQDMHVDTETCLLIDPNEYLTWLKSQIHVEHIDDRVLSISNDVITGLKTKTLFQRFFLGTGAYSRKEPIEIQLNNEGRNYLDACRVVPGKFALFQLCDLGPDSFVLSHGHFNLVYRAWSQEILIGGTTHKDESLDDKGELDLQITFFRELLSFELPNPVHVDIGLRHKGRKRLPELLQVGEKGWGLWGTYKNGWSLPHYLLKHHWIDKI